MMDDKKKMVPRIRFRGFGDAWEQCKLGDVVQITMGQSPDSRNYTDNPRDFILVQGNADMKNGLVVPRVWTKQVTKRSSKGDLILSVRAPVGEVGKTEFDVVLGRGVAGIKGNEFIFQSLLNFKMSGYWSKFSTGSTFMSISSEDIRKAILSLPDCEEQNKIGTFLKKCDNLIVANEKKGLQLKGFKKLLIEKIFSQSLRFKGFRDPWEQRKLKSFGQVLMNKRIFKQETSENGEIPFYKIGTFGKKADAFISKELFTTYKKKYSYPKIGDILISAAGTLGRTIEYQGEDAYYQDSNIVWFDHDENLLNSFLKFFYQTLSWDKSEGSTIKRLYNKDILNLRIMVPTVEEQSKVGLLLEGLDNLIVANEKKLDQLKQLKKYLMQNMFV